MLMPPNTFVHASVDGTPEAVSAMYLSSSFDLSGRPIVSMCTSAQDCA
jgi:hypothetical protein